MNCITASALQSVHIRSSQQQQQQQQQQGLNLNKLSLKLNLGLHAVHAMLCTVEGQEWEAYNAYSVLSQEQLVELSDYIAAYATAATSPPLSIGAARMLPDASGMRAYISSLESCLPRRAALLWTMWICTLNCLGNGCWLLLLTFSAVLDKLLPLLLLL
jgi:hypothetical protein